MKEQPQDDKLFEQLREVPTELSKQHVEKMIKGFAALPAPPPDPSTQTWLEQLLNNIGLNSILMTAATVAVVAGVIYLSSPDENQLPLYTEINIDEKPKTEVVVQEDKLSNSINEVQSNGYSHDHGHASSAPATTKTTQPAVTQQTKQIVSEMKMQVTQHLDQYGKPTGIADTTYISKSTYTKPVDKSFSGNSQASLEGESISVIADTMFVESKIELPSQGTNNSIHTDNGRKNSGTKNNNSSHLKTEVILDPILPEYELMKSRLINTHEKIEVEDFKYSLDAIHLLDNNGNFKKSGGFSYNKKPHLLFMLKIGLTKYLMSEQLVQHKHTPIKITPINNKPSLNGKPLTSTQRRKLSDMLHVHGFQIRPNLIIDIESDHIKIGYQNPEGFEGIDWQNIEIEEMEVWKLKQ